MSSEQPKARVKSKYNPFLFAIVSELSLDELIKYSNYSALVKGVVDASPDANRKGLDYYIKRIFKKNIRDKRIWKTGGYRNLSLTDEFYNSDTAERVFKRTHGLKRSQMILSPISDVELQTKSVKNTSDEDECDDDDDSDIERIDLTMDLQSDENNLDPPKRKTKYPRKHPPNILPLTSGIAAYTATSKFVDQIPVATSTTRFNDEIDVSSTESTIEVVNPQPNERKHVESAKRVEVISDIVLVLPTQFRDEELQRQQPETKEVLHRSSQNRDALVPINQQLPLSSPDVPSKPKTVPESKVQQRTSRVVYIDEESQEMQETRLVTAETTSKTVDFMKPKPKIGPKSRMRSVNPCTVSTQELLYDLLYTNPSENVSDNQQNEDVLKTRPRMKSLADALPSLSTIESELEAPIESPHQPPPSTYVIEPEGVFDPNTVISNNFNLSKSLPLIFTTVNTENFNFNEMHWEHENIHNAEPKKNVASSNDYVTQPSCQSPLMIQLNISSEGNIHESVKERIQIESAENPTNESSSNLCELTKNVLQSFDALHQQFKKYVAETEPNALSLKHFLHKFLKSEYDSDSSATETQLNENVDYVLIEQSQPIFDPNQFQISEAQSQSVLSQEVVDFHPNLYTVEPLDSLNAQIKQEKMSDDGNNNSWSSDVEIIEVPPSEPIEISMDSTQELVENLQGHEPNTEEQPIEPFVMPQQPIASCSKTKSPGASSKSKGFLTSLPKVATKKRNYLPLEIVVEAAQKILPVVLPMHDFSQQPDLYLSDENYEIEECTMTDSQHQRYELLNNENTMFLSSQLENYALNTGKTTDLKSAVVPISHVKPMLNRKRLSPNVLDTQSNKRIRCSETVKRELNWKIMDIRSITFKPSINNTFHLELQLRNDFDTFHIQCQQSIRRLLHLNDNEWNHVVKILMALSGYRYDASTTAITSHKVDLPSRVMDCFVQTIPMFVRSNIQFKDFMENCVEVSEQQPLVHKCVDAAIDPTILKKMKKFKQNL